MKVITTYRVHGDIKVKRRSNYSIENHYSKYRTPLMEDFSEICGYCGKHILVTRKGFEIDHFVPVSKDKGRETDYNNLVFSCFTCNRKKSKKWPTNDKNVSHDDKKGFVDPASDEYDTHLGRNSSGAIEQYTEVGQYMYDTFKFGFRPTDIVWKCMELYKRKNKLYKIDTSSLTEEQLQLFFSIQRNLDELLEYLVGTGE